MKKTITAILAAAVALSAFFAVPASAGIIGEVITTDIVTYIDEQPIESYNINGYTYVIAEELQSYGFAVSWRAEERRLDIYELGGELPREYPSADLINVRKDAVVKGQHAFDVYETDIVTCLNNEPVNAYNVDGQTLIQVDELARFGYFSYNDARREVKIAKAAFYADWLYSSSSKQALTLPSEKIEGTITYSGDVADGKPNGLGRITEEYEFTNGLQSSEVYITTGKFIAGEPYDKVVLYKYGKKIPHNGSDRRVREYYTFRGAKIGYSPGVQYTVEHIDDGSQYRTEEIYGADGALTYRRETVYDPEYRFGYRVVREGPVNDLGQYVDYHETAAGKITFIEADSSGGYAVDENGQLFGIGRTALGTRPVPVKLADNAKAAAGEDTVLGADGVLYDLSDGTELARDVIWASEHVYLTSSGALYNRNGSLIDTDVSEASAQDRLVLYKKADGSVYSVRLNLESEGYKWNDGLDLSAPTPVFDRAKSVSRGNRFLVVDENNTLWGWSSYWYGTPYQDNSGNLFSTKAPIRLAENVAFADSGTGFIAYVTTDGKLYAMADATEPDNEMLFGIKEPVLLMEHVSMISAGGGYMLILSEEGQMYAWGQNKEGRLGTGNRQDEELPVPVFRFYELNQ